MLATTTALITLPSTTMEVSAHSRQTKPNTLSRLLLEEDTQ